MNKIAAIAMITFGASLLALPQDTLEFHIEKRTDGCPQGNVTAPLRALEPDDFVELQRTGCFGTCPAYKVRIYADGRIQWQGDHDVFSAGLATRSVTPEKARALIEKYRANNFWSLCASYSAPITDGPTFYTTVRVGEPAKRVSNYFGVAPAWLQDLEDEIDELANTYEWIKGNWESQLFTHAPDPNAGPASPQVAFVQIWEAAAGNRPGATPLMRAAGRGEVSEVERLLAAKADPNATDRSGWTPLMYAAGGDAPAQTIPILLAAGADPKTRSMMGQTALMAASSTTFYTKARELKLLIDAGADVNTQDSNGQTAMVFASSHLFENGDERIAVRAEMLALLRSSGALTELRDSYGVTALDRFNAQAPRADRPAMTVKYNAIRKILTDDIPTTNQPVKVSGRVVSEGLPSKLVLERMGTGVAPLTVAVGTGGAFEFPAVPPGVYSIRVADSSPIPLPETAITVGKQIPDFELRLPPLRQITIRSTVEDNETLPGFALLIKANGGERVVGMVRIGRDLPEENDLRRRLNQEGELWQWLPGTTFPPRIALSTTGADGTSAMTLPDGSYSIAVVRPSNTQYFPGTYEVKSLTQDGRDLQSTPLKVGDSNPSEIEVVLSRR